MSFDRVQLLRGDAAEDYAEEHGGDSDDGPQRADRQREPAHPRPGPGAGREGPRRGAAGGEQRPGVGAAETLLDALDSKGSTIPLELRYDKLGYVVQVTEKRYA